MAQRDVVFPAGRQALYERNRYSPAVRSNGFLFVSGQVGSREDGSPEPDLAAQARLAFQNLNAVLQAAGYAVQTAATVAEAERALAEGGFALVVADVENGEAFRLAAGAGRGTGLIGLAGRATPALLEQARYTQPYLYTHPNVSSMMAGLCVFVFGGRLVAGVADRRQAAALVAGATICLGYLWMMGSRGPQAVFAMTALAAPAVLLPGWRARAAAVLAAVLVALALWSAMGVVNPRFKDVATMRRYNNRTIVWNHTSMLLREWSPWVGFGFGKKAFKRAYYENPNQRAPFTPDRNLIFPHAHSYWRMVRFEGGWLGLVVCLAAWVQLAFASARAMMRASRRARARGWMAALRARGLGGTLATCLGFILLYGVWDYPDHLIRHSQFLLLALLAAWNALPHED